MSSALRGYRVPKSLAIGRPRTAAASVFFVGRAVEQMVSQSEGDRDARHWLEVCAARRERVDGPGLGRGVPPRRSVPARPPGSRPGVTPPKVGVDAFRAALHKEFKGTEQGATSDAERAMSAGSRARLSR